MSELTLTYLGGPTAVLGYAGLRLVTDPTFDAPQRYVSEGETTLVKTVGPGIERTDLGPIDGILLSYLKSKYSKPQSPPRRPKSKFKGGRR